jgi:hypothetical protein
MRLATGLSKNVSWVSSVSVIRVNIRSVGFNIRKYSEHFCYFFLLLLHLPLCRLLIPCFYPVVVSEQLQGELVVQGVGVIVGPVESLLLFALKLVEGNSGVELCSCIPITLLSVGVVVEADQDGLVFDWAVCEYHCVCLTNIRSYLASWINFLRHSSSASS